MTVILRSIWAHVLSGLVSMLFLLSPSVQPSLRRREALHAEWPGLSEVNGVKTVKMCRDGDNITGLWHARLDILDMVNLYISFFNIWANFDLTVKFHIWTKILIMIGILHFYTDFN